MNDLSTLSEELDKLRVRAGVAVGLTRVSLAEVAKRARMPATRKSTLHNYLTGKTLAPSDVLDAIVLALGATATEAREWGDAWFRVEASRRTRNPSDGGDVVDVPAIDSLLARAKLGEALDLDLFSVSAHNVDVIHKVTTIAPDHEEEVQEPTVAAGGSGANTAAVASLLGLRAAVTGCVGNDSRMEVLRANLKSFGVDQTLLLTAEREAQSGHAQVFTDSKGGRLIYVTPGANSFFASGIALGDRLEEVIEHLRRSRWVHLSSFASHNERMLQEASVAALNQGQILSLTPGSLYSSLGADKLRSILIRVNVLFLYEQHLDSLLAFSGAQAVAPHASLVERVRSLVRWRASISDGPVEPLLVVVKRPEGLHGGHLNEYLTAVCGREDVENVSRPDVRSIRAETYDATGAGDSLAAGTIFGLLSGLQLDEVVNIAFVLAMVASSAIGARAAFERRGVIEEYWAATMPSISLPPVLGGYL